MIRRPIEYKQTCSMPSTTTRSTWSAPAGRLRRRSATRTTAPTRPRGDHVVDRHARRRSRRTGRRPERVIPDEVTRTLASLADLRDRGAISPEEYEHKKADLLGAPVAPTPGAASHDYADHASRSQGAV